MTETDFRGPTRQDKKEAKQAHKDAEKAAKQRQKEADKANRPPFLKRRVTHLTAAALVGAGAGLYLGDKVGYTQGQEDCLESITPDSNVGETQMYGLDSQDVDDILALKDRKNVDIETTAQHLSSLGLQGILDTLNASEGLKELEVLAQPVEGDTVSPADLQEATFVQGAIVGWTDYPHSVEAITPTGFVDDQTFAGAQYVVRITPLTCDTE